MWESECTGRADAKCVIISISGMSSTESSSLSQESIAGTVSIREVHMPAVGVVGGIVEAIQLSRELAGVLMLCTIVGSSGRFGEKNFCVFILRGACGVGSEGPHRICLRRRSARLTGA